MAGGMYMRRSNRSNGETFLKQYILLNGIPRIKTDKMTTFTAIDIRQRCKNLIINLIYSTPLIHTATGRVELGLKHLNRCERT